MLAITIQKYALNIYYFPGILLSRNKKKSAHKNSQSRELLTVLKIQMIL